MPDLSAKHASETDGADAGHPPVAPRVVTALPRIARRLRAPEPGWAETTDVVVVGSGIAGLAVALHLREAGLHVTVVTKVNIHDGSTRWAQGGIAAVLDPADSAAAHAADTIVAGAGLCDPAAVDFLVREGPERIRELIRWGAGFDRGGDGGAMTGTGWKAGDSKTSSWSMSAASMRSSVPLGYRRGAYPKIPVER